MPEAVQKSFDKLLEELTSLQGELSTASEEYERASETVREARSEETDALNRLHGVQKKFDAVVAKLHEMSPQGSTWRREHIERSRPPRRQPPEAPTGDIIEGRPLESLGG